MASRPIWRGHLRLALVTCPIALHGVVRASGDLHFHYINPKTGNRVRMVTMDAETDAEVSRRDLVKGYEFEKDRYVLLDDTDFEQAKIESSSTLTVAKFVDRGEIEPIYFDTSYYVVPDGDAGQDVYCVLRDAMKDTGRAALSRVVIARRERAVAIFPMGKGMVCHTLHEPRDLYESKPLFDAIADDKPDFVVEHCVGRSRLPVRGELLAACLVVPPPAGGECRIGQAAPHLLGAGMDVRRVDEIDLITGLHHECRPP